MRYRASIGMKQRTSLTKRKRLDRWQDRRCGRRRAVGRITLEYLSAMANAHLFCGTDRSMVPVWRERGLIALQRLRRIKGLVG